MEYKEVDARGRSCPEPVILTKNALNMLNKGCLMVLVNTEVAKENVSRFARNTGYIVEIEKLEGEYKILITKG